MAISWTSETLALGLPFLDKKTPRIHSWGGRQIVPIDSVERWLKRSIPCWTNAT